MAAQMKDYAYSDNADVLKGKVNAGKPVPKNSGNITAQMKDLNPPNPLARDSSRETLHAKSQAMHASLADKKKSDSLIASKGSSQDRSQFAQDVNNAAGAVGNTFKSVGSWARDGIKDLANTPFMPGTRDYLFGTQKSTLDKEGARLAAASNSNTFKGSSLQGTGNNPVFQPGTSVASTPTSSPAPVNPSSPFAKPNSNGMINVEDFKNVPPRSSSFNPSGMTIGNTSGSSQPAGMRQGGPQSPGNMVSDYTNLFA